MHIGIIMDGNRRWAKQKMLPSFMGHKSGFENALRIIRHIGKKQNITHLTLWALSKENLVKREQEEIAWIVSLINKLEDFLPELQENNIRFETIWDIEQLPEDSQKILNNLKSHTQNNTWYVLTAALVYSWQDEIIRAIKKAYVLWENISQLNEKTFRQFLDTASIPPPDLIIRTGWDTRHSGFLLYDCDYSEYVFSQKMWPDFWPADLDNALEQFSWVKRNFWK